MRLYCLREDRGVRGKAGRPKDGGEGGGGGSDENTRITAGDLNRQDERKAASYPFEIIIMEGGNPRFVTELRFLNYTSARKNVRT